MFVFVPRRVPVYLLTLPLSFAFTLTAHFVDDDIDDDEDEDDYILHDSNYRRLGTL